MLGKNVFKPIKDGSSGSRGVVYRDLNGNITYLSFVNNRRYGCGCLGFKGFEEDFMRAVRSCPPDSDDSFDHLEKAWLPTLEQR